MDQDADRNSDAYRFVMISRVEPSARTFQKAKLALKLQLEFLGLARNFVAGSAD
jgi:hypothetical protein